MPTLISPEIPHPRGNRYAVRVDGKPMTTSVSGKDIGVFEWDSKFTGIASAEVAEIEDAGEYKLVPGYTYILVYTAPNSHQLTRIKRLENLQIVAQMTKPFLSIFLLIADPDAGEWCIDFDEPRAHSHGQHLRRWRGNSESYIRCDNERDNERNHSTEMWNSTERMLNRR